MRNQNHLKSPREGDEAEDKQAVSLLDQLSFISRAKKEWIALADDVLKGKWDGSDGSTIKSLLYGLKSPSLMRFSEVKRAIEVLKNMKPTPNKHGRISKRRRKV